MRVDADGTSRKVSDITLTLNSVVDFPQSLDATDWVKY